MIQIPETQHDLDILSSQLKDKLTGEDLIPAVEQHIEALDSYFRHSKIKDVFIGVSGGIDSAVAFEMLRKTSVNVHPYFFSFYEFKNVDVSYINILERRTGHNIEQIDLSSVLDLYLKTINKNRGMSIDQANFQVEQTLYSLRYNALFSLASVMGGVTIGTTNKDELLYSGWFGKHSDMNVDIQFLHRYHKSQIIKIAEHLKVPDSIIKRTPSGDLPDNSADEENFGCTYDELTWYSTIGKYLTPTVFMYAKFSKLQKLHEKNSHKYDTKEITHFNPVFL